MIDYFFAKAVPSENKKYVFSVEAAFGSTMNMNDLYVSFSDKLPAKIGQQERKADKCDNNVF